MKRTLFAAFICTFLVLGIVPAWAAVQYNILCDTAAILIDKTNEAQAVKPSCAKAVSATSRPGATFLEFKPRTTNNDDGPLSPLTNLRTMGWFGSIALNWDIPTGQQQDNIEVWESDHDDLAAAVKIADLDGRSTTYDRYLGSFKGRYYWVRASNRTGLVSPWNSTSGTYGYSEQEGSGKSNAAKATNKVFSVYAKSRNGDYVQTYRTESESDLNWYSLTIAKDSTYDLVQGDDQITSYVLLCVDQPAAPTPSQGYSIAGTWNYSGSGTVGGISATDSGSATVETSGSTGNQSIARISWSGTFRLADGRSLPYSYSQAPNVPFNGSFTIQEDGITYVYTQTGEKALTATATGRQTSSGISVNMSYSGTKQDPSSGGGGGGGCNTGFAPTALLVLLAVPLWGLRRYNRR